jgi:NADPH-dependent ferric siderophore reductase
MADARPVRTRTPPPPLRPVQVISTEALSSRMLRILLGGDALDGLVIDEIAASVRVVIAWPGEVFVLPEWNGNEFLLADGRRPALRTFTPVVLVDNTITLDIVRHPGGAISDWAETAQPGDPAAISGPGRGETIDPNANRYVLLGDETAMPAIRQLIEAIPASIDIEVHLETETADAALPLPDRATTHWHVADPGGTPGSTLLAALRTIEIGDNDRVWAAGEAAAVQALRKHLFNERGIDRSRATVRGYWKVPRPTETD